MKWNFPGIRSIGKGNKKKPNDMKMQMVINLFTLLYGACCVVKSVMP
jgi:hypothetical protein